MSPLAPRVSPAQFARTPRRAFNAGPRLTQVQSIDDLRARTHQLMPRFVLEYLEGGAQSEATLERDRTAFEDWRWVPRMLRDVSHRKVSRRVLGQDARLPLAIAPTGLNGLFMRGADLTLARAAARFGVPFVQGTMSNETMEDVARVPGLRHWWQLYIFGPDEIWQALVDRAAACKCEALVLTVNAQLYGLREWDSRQRFGRTLPKPATVLDAAWHTRWLATTLSHGMPRFANVEPFLPEDSRGFFEGAFWIRDQMPKALTWADVARIRERWKGAMFVKGLLHPDDVRAARDSGVDGVMLGTHGGRQADEAVSALDVLEEARAILGDDRPLWISGGIRRGGDVLKALALGADGVLAGRAPLYGLCAHGEAGVLKALVLLETEMRNQMGQIGADTLDDIGSHLLRRV
ncbi:alpha-hydroxy-acid oxidizing protein [Novosphingobium profundi]|uniref:alpha-hydroxy acid oxidase n=1 Tax=Novosphingobium profundi TaxID=1774954 RepID=UPI001BD9A453|nr:alpha-hydroxy acid oxidase [Novosphingobium profundi]MBT0670601.1 alpha-hydroxy-acid oxidizing protein [Novosphingobium profundi]